ncbi:MAG TPA: 3-oxoadipate enol-lactonase [Steroidobacter sp.]|jgi:3-oxoadipate enol-lactonase|nr:3-oxoadipate enol-lactonase [Steroidobacter sp.]
MKLVSVSGAQLRCEHAAQAGAPALLMLNALGTSLEMWDDQEAPLAERYELIRYDARGHGKSTAGSQSEPSMDDLARDAIAILDACGVARAHLCGLSLGGMTAMHLATHWPDRVLKVAICSSSPYMPLRENWDARIRTVLQEGMSPLVETILGRWFTPEFHVAEPARVDRIRQMLLSCDPKGYAACCAAIRDMDQRDSIKTITAKTLVIGGLRDQGTPPALAELIARSIPDAKLTMLDAAHLSNIERAQEFTRTLLEFFA